MKYYVPFILLALADLLLAGVFLVDGMSDYLFAAIGFLVIIHIGIGIMILIMFYDGVG
jgi:hypothetical protein